MIVPPIVDACRAGGAPASLQPAIDWKSELDADERFRCLSAPGGS